MMPIFAVEEPDAAYINLPLPKGCICRLPLRQYAEGIKRGKQWQRAQRAEKRQAQRRTQETQAPWVWLDEENA